MIRLEGADDLQRALRDLPPTLDRELAKASADIADTAARTIARAARTPAERKTAATVRASRRGGPGIAAGGGQSAAARMFFGTEFGSRRPQFRPWSGTRGYWFYPTIRSQGRRWAELWIEAADRATAKEWRN